MGVSIAVWSPIHGSGKTVFTFLLSNRLSQLVKRDAKIMVCCTCMSENDIMGIAGAAKDNPSMDELVNAGVPSTNTDISICSLLYHIGNVYFIGSSKATPLFVRKNTTGYLHLMEYLKQEFDLVITDTSSEPGNLLTQLAMESCDHVLKIFVQDMQLLGKYPPATPKDIAGIINRYTSIYPDYKEISRLLKTVDLIALPYCNQLQEIKNRNQLLRYLELDTEYMRGIDKLARFLGQILDIPFKDGKKNKGLIRLFRKGEEQ